MVDVFRVFPTLDRKCRGRQWIFEYFVSLSGPIGSWSPAPKLDSRPFSSFSMSDFSDFPSSERLLLWAVDAAV